MFVCGCVDVLVRWFVDLLVCWRLGVLLYGCVDMLLHGCVDVTEVARWCVGSLVCCY